MIENIFNDIDRAKENKAYLSALALALTLPDMCGRQEYGEIENGKRYKKWYNKWVYPYYELPIPSDKLMRSASNKTRFDGEMAYLLRCSVLHSGNTCYRENFQLTFSLLTGDAQKGYSIICNMLGNSVSSVEICLNVVDFIDKIILGTKDYLQANDKIVESCNLKIEVLGEKQDING